MRCLDWEVTGIELSTRARYRVTGINHCCRDEIDRDFIWHLDGIDNPRYFASDDLSIPSDVAARMQKFGQAVGEAAAARICGLASMELPASLREGGACRTEMTPAETAEIAAAWDLDEDGQPRHRFDPNPHLDSGE